MNAGQFTAPRSVERIIKSHPSADGDGVQIRRIHDFGGGIDPFLMLDELGSDQPDDYIGGFPSHPHRGIQTLTYVIHGGLTHEDHMGHTSTIRAGDAQWMHTGRGIVHSEMPLTDSQGLHAFQLWLNLAAKDKLSPATYRDVRSHEMPHFEASGGKLTALGGEWTRDDGTHIEGPLNALAGNAGIAHASLESGGTLKLACDQTTLLIYVFSGSVEIEGQRVDAGQLARLSSGDHVTLHAHRDSQALVLAGTPHNEPIAHYGPFVMNSRDELEQTLQAYRDGTLTE